MVLEIAEYICILFAVRLVLPWVLTLVVVSASTAAGAAYRCLG